MLRSILLSLLLSTTAIAENTDWITLFNGKDLEGWSVQCQAKDADKEYWRAENGCIVVNSIGNKDHNYIWLMTDDEFANFELHLKFQVFKDSPGNSGVQIRSRYDKNAEWLDGPQLDIHAPSPFRTGLIYDETRGTKRWISPSLEQGNHNIKPERVNTKIKLLYGEDLWNDMIIIAKGTKIKCIVNGEVATDFEGASILDDGLHKKYNVGLKGHIALQLHHNDELHAKFKDIKIRRL